MNENDLSKFKHVKIQLIVACLQWQCLLENKHVYTLKKDSLLLKGRHSLEKGR